MKRCMKCMNQIEDTAEVCPNCGYDNSNTVDRNDQLQCGLILSGRYVIGLPLGRGGFGITYIAWDETLMRRVAIKEYLPRGLAIRESDNTTVRCDNESKYSFCRGIDKTIEESRKLAGLSHLDSVVTVFDCFKANGTAYIVMELLEGKNVKEYLQEKGKLSFEETIEVMTPVLNTLSTVHKEGIIHRDISPDNIFLCDSGKVKVLDFGSARTLENLGEGSHSIVLKHGYAPKEQYSSRGKQGTYTDIYATAATMYKMLTGITPEESLERISGDDELEDISELADIPQKAADAIMQGLELREKDRIQTADEFLMRLTENEKPLPEDDATVTMSTEAVRQKYGDLLNRTELKDEKTEKKKTEAAKIIPASIAPRDIQKVPYRVMPAPKPIPVNNAYNAPNYQTNYSAEKKPKEKKSFFKSVISIILLIITLLIITLLIIVLSDSFGNEKMEVGTKWCDTRYKFGTYIDPVKINGMAEAKGTFIPKKSGKYIFYSGGNVTVTDSHGNSYEGTIMADRTARLELDCEKGKKYKVKSKTTGIGKYIGISDDDAVFVGSNTVRSMNYSFYTGNPDAIDAIHNNISYYSFTPEKDGNYTFMTDDPAFISFVTDDPDYFVDIWRYNIDFVEEYTGNNRIVKKCYAGKTEMICVYHESSFENNTVRIEEGVTGSLSVGTYSASTGNHIFVPDETGFYRIRSISSEDFDITIDGYDDLTRQDCWLYEDGDTYDDKEAEKYNFCTCIRANADDMINFNVSYYGGGDSTFSLEICKISDEYYNAFKTFYDLKENGIYISDTKTIYKDIPSYSGESFRYAESDTRYPHSFCIKDHQIWICYSVEWTADQKEYLSFFPY